MFQVGLSIISYYDTVTGIVPIVTKMAAILSHKTTLELK